MTVTVTAETLTDEQIREVRVEASDHAVTVECRAARRLPDARRKLDAACLEAFEADQDGPLVEHLNHRVLDASRLVGRALQARTRIAAILNARKESK